MIWISSPLQTIHIFLVSSLYSFNGIPFSEIPIVWFHQIFILNFSFKRHIIYKNWKKNNQIKLMWLDRLSCKHWTMFTSFYGWFYRIIHFKFISKITQFIIRNVYISGAQIYYAFYRLYQKTWMYNVWNNFAYYWRFVQINEK